jgi:hypothetical protein
LFKDRHLYPTVSQEDKEAVSFVVNQYLSKKYPNEANLLNYKCLDKAAIVDMWFLFMKSKPYPTWFWQQQKKDSNSEDLSLLIENGYCLQDAEFILRFFPDEFNQSKDILRNQLLSE